jgi:hypothetical protein
VTTSDETQHPSRTAETSWFRARWHSPVATRRAGRIMIGVGIAGLLIAVFGTIVGWIFVGQLATASDDTLDVTLQSLDAVDDTIDLADDVLGSSVDAVDALAGSLAAGAGSFGAGTQAIDEIAGLAVTLGPSLEDAGRTVRRLEGIGNDLDSLLGALSNLPLTPDYNPDAALGETFGQLADTLEVLPAQLESTSTSLTDFTGSADELQQQLDDLAASVVTIGDDLRDTDALVDQYRASVTEARALALSANDDLDTGATLMRILLVLGGVTLLFGQIVPLWLGRSLLDDADALDEQHTVRTSATSG